MRLWIHTTILEGMEVVKSLIAFSHHVLQDLGNRCRISTSRDKKTVTARIEHEGISFLTISLSTFGKDFQKSLDLGCVGPEAFLGFERRGELPVFLGGFLDLVFNRETGLLLDKPSIDAIYAVRQFTLMFAKINLECAERRTRAAFRSFVKCEQELRESEAQWMVDKDLVDQFRRVVLVLYGEMFTNMDRKIYDGDITPRHGPGQTAEKLSANSKYSMTEWTERLEEVFDFGQMLFPNFGWYETFQSTELLEPGAERPVRVVAVPKTLKTPRIIAIEPAVMQYMQQGILEAFREDVQKSDTLRHLIGDEYQDPNRIMAHEASRKGHLATLDLSEASDRVSNQLVRIMFDRWHSLHDAIDATRSRKADVPDHGVLRLAKFASMGSAMCFMVEMLVFNAIIFMALERSLNRQLTKSDVKSAIGWVRVYGDDIIVPVTMVHSVVELLEVFGLKVNRDKSFWTGKFRESCGGDYYDGRDVTPIRVRSVFPSQRSDALQIGSTVALRNLLFDKGGFDESVEYLDGKLSSLLPIYRDVPRDSNALGRWTHEPIEADGIHKHTQRPFIKAPVLLSRIPEDNLSDYGALMKFFLKRGDLPFADRKHLERAGRPSSVDIKMRKVTL